MSKPRIITDPDELWLRQRNARMRADRAEGRQKMPPLVAGTFGPPPIPVVWKGIAYPSIRAAARATGDDWFTVKAGATPIQPHLKKEQSNG